MAIEVASDSRFIETEVVEVDSQETFGLWKRPNFLDRTTLNEEDIQLLSIDSDLAGRPDQIANRLYGSPFLDWVIVMFNRPRNTLNWPPIGSVIEFVSEDIVAANT